VLENDKIALIYSTFPTPESAEAAGGALVEARLAACVNIMPAMTSIYLWQGSRHRDSETVMIIKTRAKLVDDAIAQAKRHHPYTNPAFVVLPVEGGAEPFLQWIKDQTQD
jgi:periplasmic divalent cation tolerance protein